MEHASSFKSKLRRIPLLLATLWTVLIMVLIIDVAATPDEFGLNGVVIMGLLLFWILGLALGLGVRAVVRWLLSGRARVRIVPIVVGLALCGVLAGVVYASASRADRSSPLARLRWTDETPAWSPNAHEVVFASNRDLGRGGIDHLYLMSSNGTDSRRLTAERRDAREPSFSPDGKEVVFAANVLDAAHDYTERGAIDLISVDGTHRRSLTAGLRGDASRPTWSPNGRWIAFVDTVSTDSGAGSRSDLYVVRRDGTDLHRLAFDIDDWSQPLSWAPDSRQIAVVGGDERIYRIGVDARRPVRVRHDKYGVVTTDVAWSPDGTKIAYVRGRIETNTCFCDADGSYVTDRHLSILDLENHRRARLRSLVDSDLVGDFGVTVTWLRAGRPLLAVFAGDRTALITTGGRKVRTIKTPNGGMLTTGSASATGREILFVDDPDESYRSALFAANARTGRVRPLTQRGRAAG